MTAQWLKTVGPCSISRLSQQPVDAETIEAARGIIDRVRQGGDGALRACIKQYECRDPESLFRSKRDLAEAFKRLPAAVQGVLERTATRIDAFASAQRACIGALTVPIDGGEAGHDVAPVDSAACYAPGGRFPLPSSVLMTAITARVAGVSRVVVVTPSSADIMLGAAYIAGADAVLHAGGAHAVAAVAYGTESVTPVDMIVGPGNRWVTAAKSIVNGVVGIDMLAGPSELLVVADDTVCPKLIAADLLAQAEHDPDARPILVTQSPNLVRAVNTAIGDQLANLATATIAREALKNGLAVVCQADDEIVDVVNTIAPEHLEIIGPSMERLAPRIRHYGGLFLGRDAAEVLGDYGAGPNHTLPTGGTARFSGGLSVFNFLRIRTWMRIDALDDAQPLVDDANTLAQLEGLAGHARSAQCRSLN
ncbi:MAG: histidinol dehydrogenase [Myxococcales bacterium]|nr:histidinol dehydrogenase [Myxococcales bacterium]